jgi:hypothetical protein
MPYFSLGVTYSNIADEEQTDVFFADDDPNANTITQFPPVYARSDWQVIPAFSINPIIDAEGIGETENFEMTRVVIDGAYHPTGDWNQLPKPPGQTGRSELIIPVGFGSTLADNPNVTFNGQSSTLRINLEELQSPMNDSWSYLSAGLANTIITETSEFPEANTYPGLYEWTEPNPDTYSVTYQFTVYGRVRGFTNEPYSATFTVDQNFYFDYSPYVTLIPQIVSQGAW